MYPCPGDAGPAPDACSRTVRLTGFRQGYSVPEWTNSGNRLGPYLGLVLSRN
jgi:hypothetical protein